MAVANRMIRRSTTHSSCFVNRNRRRRLLLEQLEDRSLLAADAGISGTKWEDLNGNSVRDSGEPPLAGVTVYLDTNDNGSRDAGELFTATAADGTYSFPALEAGSYVVREEVPADYQRTFPLISGARLFTTNSTNNPDQILELNPANGTIIRTIPAPVPTGSTVTGLAFDGQSLFFLSDSNDTLYRLNPDTGAIQNLTGLSSRTYGGLAAAGGFVYAVDTSLEDILRLDRNTGALLATLDINAVNPGLNLNDGLGESSTGELLGATSSGIVFLNPVTGVQTGVLTVASPSSVRALTSVGNEIFLGYGFSNRIDVVSRTGTLLRSFTTNHAVVGLGGWGDVSGAHRVTLPSGQTATNVNFGNQYTLVDIRGNKWEDQDGDGLRDAGEPPLAGVTVYLDANDNAARDVGEPATLTAADGSYAFPALPAGKYVVREEVPADYVRTFPSISGARLFTTDTNVSPDRILELNPATGAVIRSFAAPVPSGSITAGLAFDGQTIFFISDAFSNDTFYRLNPDTGAVLSSVVLPQRAYGGLAATGGFVYALDSGQMDILRLDRTTGAILATLDINAANPGIVLNDALGEVAATGELVGVTSNGLVFLNPTTGGQTGALPIASPSSVRAVTAVGNELFVGYGLSSRVDVVSRAGLLLRSFTTPYFVVALGGWADLSGAHRVTLSPGQPATNVNFGNQYARAEIRGTKWEDLDGDAFRDAGEPGTGGVLVYLDGNKNGVLDAGEPTATTAADGSYSFSVLTPGELVVREQTPANYLQTFPRLQPARMFVIDQNASPSQIVELDPATGSYRGSIPSPVTSLSIFSGLAFDGQTLYVLSDATNDVLFELNPDTGAIIDSSPLPARNYSGVAVLGQSVFLLDFSQQDVLRFDPVADVVTATFDLNVLNPGLSISDGLGEYGPTGEFMAITSSPSALTFFDAATGLRTAVLPIPSGARGLTSIGEEIFVGFSNRIDVYNRSGSLLRSIANSRSLIALGGSVSDGGHRLRLATGQGAVNVDFGNRSRLGEIRGVKWDDADGDGTIDAGEARIAGALVYADLNQNAQFDAGEPNAVTAAEGSYVLPGLQGGEYFIRDEVPQNYRQSFPAFDVRSYDSWSYLIQGSSQMTLTRIDPDSGVVTRVGNPTNFALQGLVRTNSGELFGIDGTQFQNDRFYSVNPVTGATTLIGNTGLEVAWGLAYDAQTDTIYGLGVRSNTNTIHLVRFNRLTGEAIVIGQGEVGSQISATSGIAFDPNRRVIVALDNSDDQFWEFDLSGKAKLIWTSPTALDGFGLAHNGRNLVHWPRGEGANNLLREVDPYHQTFGSTFAAQRFIGMESLDATLVAGAHRVLLNAGQTLNNIDFGNQFILVDIQGTKWSDQDGDGVRDASEAALPGVVVYLDADNDGVRDSGELSTTTAGDGSYGFFDLQPGDYVVREEAAANYQATFPRLAAGRLFGIDWFANPDRIVELDPMTGGFVNSLPSPTSLFATSGLAFDGTTLYLMSESNDTLFELNPDTGAVLDSTPILAGNYSGLASQGGKVYILDWFTRDVHVFDPVADVITTTLSLDTINFGLSLNDGFGEFGPAGELVAFSADTAIFFNAQTGRRTGTFPIGSGTFPAGATAIGDEIYVAQDNPNRIEVYSREGTLLRTVPLSFSAVGLAGKGEVVRGEHHLSLGPAENASGVDFGNQYTLGDIRGTKWEDLDADGKRDAGEPPLAGIVVYLDANDNSVRDPSELWTTTGPDGAYAFTGLTPGQYIVREISTVNFAQTFPAFTVDRLFAVDVFPAPNDLIYELNPATGAVLNSFVAPLPSGQIFTGLAFDGETLYFLSFLNDVLYEVDPDTGVILDSTVLPEGGYDGLAALGGLIYAKNSNSNIVVFDPVSDIVVRTFTLTGFATAFLTDGLGEITDPDRLIAQGLGGDFIQINPQTGAASLSFVNNANWASVRGFTSIGQQVYVGDTNKRIDVFSRSGDLLRTMTVLPSVFGLAGKAGTFGAHRVVVDMGEVISGLDFGNERLNTPPTADAGGPYSVGEGGTVVLDGSGSTDPDQPAATLLYAWDLDGDNVFGEVGAGAERGDEQGPNPVFSAAGLDGPLALSVRLRVTDTFAQVDESSAAVEVTNVAPAGLALNSATIDENGTFVLQGSFTDPGPDSHIVTVAWGPGEGSTTITLPLGARTFTLSHQYLDENPPGTPQDVYAVSVVVTDDDNDSATGGATATVVNLAPVISSLSSSAACCDTAIGETVQIAGSFSDVGTLDTHTVLVDWGDGTSSFATVTEAGGSGSFAAGHAYATGGSLRSPLPPLMTTPAPTPRPQRASSAACA